MNIMVSKHTLSVLLLGFIVGFILAFTLPLFKSTFAETSGLPLPAQIIACGCPKGSDSAETAEINKTYTKNGERCVENMTEWSKSPTKNHFWIKDPEITSQGKANERARQFIYWTLQNSSIDNHPTIIKIWQSSRNLSFFAILIIAAVMGLGIIVAQRTNFQLKIQVWPMIFKILALLVYISFSATVIIILIQISELLMKFFIETLGGKDVFNIYFSSPSQEVNYIKFEGCRDLNWGVQEAAKAELSLLRYTNIVYYIMGSMVLIRKIILWFLLVLSPFLAILIPFTFIRNAGMIWIGVFFQWLMYGPLLALFLGALATIWKTGIPYIFDFSRVNTVTGYVYPTAINILYGGPHQTIKYLNNGNYVDTFVEYVISLLMLLVVTFFPWWLLRIFRDYCCDGIIAMKNILLSMYDQTRGGLSPSSPSSPAAPANMGTTIKMPREVEVPIKVKLETLEQIKRTKTEDITKSLNLTANKLTDIANFETNKQVRETVTKNLNYLTNPVQADTPTERQKYMHIRTELFNRSLKDDPAARQVLSGISTSRMEQVQRRQELIHTAPQLTPMTHVVSFKIKVSQEKISLINNSFARSVSANNTVINNIAQTAKVPAAQVQTVIQSFKQHANQAPTQIVQSMASETGLTKEQISQVLLSLIKETATNKALVKEIALKENLKEEEVQKVISAQLPLVAEPEKNIEQIVAIPPSISIEDYEEVKKMWISQYEKGEVPVTENITTRAAWVDQDAVFISNTLNKLLSANEELRQQGLDDLGFIIPIFLLNNLKGEELVVYLKAKLEAAKAVKEQIEKEHEIEARIKAKETEELIDVEKPKAEEVAKTMEMKQEMETPVEKPNKV